MVDISLDSLNSDVLPKDLYLSLRIGEQQKFAKATASKAYKFAPSAVGDRRYAKLEIYKRVGLCGISIDTEKVQGLHEISVPIGDENAPEAQGEVRYQVNIGSASSGRPITAGQEPAPVKDVNSKVQAAKAYLDQHQLEQRLSQAMQDVLRERPEDPGAFMAQRLMSGAGMMRKVAEGAGAAQAAEPAVGAADKTRPDDGCCAATKQEETHVAAPAAKSMDPQPVLQGQVEASAWGFEPAVPNPSADPLTGTSLVVMPGHIGFAGMGSYPFLIL